MRFITVGSVDDGRSTLIGHLLHDSKTLLTDQLDKPNRAAENDETPDFASLTDGPAAEREQGITTDVVYHCFTTPKRKFIIADTPGHEQYTRNMVTGASTADAAIILIDATRVDFSGRGPVFLSQTKRRSATLELLGCPNIVITANKLDLSDFDETKYQATTDAYRKLAEQVGLQVQTHFLPISASRGDNIVNVSSQTLWYQDLPLLSLLESLLANRQNAADQATHFSVQRVVRQDGGSSDDFRGYQGRLEAGRLKTGDGIKVLPGGHTTKIAEICDLNGKTESAEVDEVLTTALDTDLDISRDNSIAVVDSSVAPEQQPQAALCWFGDIPFNLRCKYLLKHITQITPIKISTISYVWDVNTLSRVESADTLKLNDTGSASLRTQQSIATAPYEENHALGAFTLIDEATNHTVAAGTIRGGGQSNSLEIWVRHPTTGRLKNVLRRPVTL